MWTLFVFAATIGQISDVVDDEVDHDELQGSPIVAVILAIAVVLAILAVIAFFFLHDRP